MSSPTIGSKSAYDELLAYQRPGDVIKLELYRDSKKLEFDIKLVNKEGNTDLLKKESQVSSILGAEFEIISKIEREAYGISSGIMVYNITNGKIRRMNIPEKFIFTKVNQKEFGNLKAFLEYMENYSGQIRIEGISPSGTRKYFSFYNY